MTHDERAERRRTMAEEVRAGATVAETARRHGVGSETVYVSCREHGVAVPKKPPKVKEPKVKEPIPVAPSTLVIIADLFSGMKYREIAGAHGITTQRVSQIYQMAVQAGIPVPRRKRGSR